MYINYPNIYGNNCPNCGYCPCCGRSRNNYPNHPIVYALSTAAQACQNTGILNSDINGTSSINAVKLTNLQQAVNSAASMLQQ